MNNIDKKLNNLRNKIDTIDRKLVKSISNRFKIAYKIKILKETAGLNREDKERENKIIAKMEVLGAKFKIDSAILKRIMSVLIDEAKKQ